VFLICIHLYAFVGIYILCVSMYIYYVRVCIVYVWVCVHVYLCMCVYVCIVMCYSISNSFVRSELGNGRFIVPVIDSIAWRFEDRPMGWSGDPYRFVQWRPDGDSVTKSCHFMWVFLVYFNFNALSYYFMWIFILFYIIMFMTKLI